MKQWFVAWMMLVVAYGAGVQSAPIEALNAENVGRWRSVLRLDYPSALFESGYFALSTNGRQLAVRSRPDADGLSYVWRWQEDAPAGALVRLPGQVADFAFCPQADCLLIINDAGQLYRHEAGSGLAVLGRLPQGLIPVQLWADDAGQAWVEAQTADGATQLLHYQMGRWQALAYAPADDPDAVVRIGRIAAPYTVTSALDGLVTVWDLQAGAALWQASNGTGQPSVFGALNSGATHLVWRDNASERLYLLDLMAQQNTPIAELGGLYAQWYFLAPAADVVMAVGVGGAPNVVAWDVARGARQGLGEYRPCQRPQPDMARLSADATTLVIACDSGLDVWRAAD